MNKHAWLLVVGSMVAPAVSFASISGASCVPQADNTMRLNCSALTTNTASVRFGFRAGGSPLGWTWSDWAGPGTFHEKVLYNLPPNQTVEWRVEEDVDGTSDEGTYLTVLPPALNALAFDVTYIAPYMGGRYILFEVGSCAPGRYLVVWDILRAGITWYQDLGLATGLPIDVVNGYTELGGASVAVILNNDSVFEWDWAGNLLASKTYANCGGDIGDTGPCPHHDLTRSPDGHTWIVTAQTGPGTSGTAWAANCPSSKFVDNGVHQLDAAWAEVDLDTTIMEMGYDPAADPGPDPNLTQCSRSPDPLAGSNIDFTHANSVDIGPSPQNPFLYLSLAQFDEVVAFRPYPDAVAWRLSGASTPLDPRGDIDILLAPGIGGDPDAWVGRTDEEYQFFFQHDAHI